MATNAELQAQLTEMTARATTAEGRVDELTKACETATAERDDARKGFAKRAKEIDTLTADLRSANVSLKAYKGSATKARNAITILKRELSPQARPFGAMRAPKTEDQAAEQAAALEAAFAGDTTELVFSDGRREIRELAPLIITGDAWRVAADKRVLSATIDLEPGDCQRQQMELRGFALLNEAGDQVGWCQLPDAILIGRNQHFQLSPTTIRF